MDRQAVGRAVVDDQLLDVEAVASEVGSSSAKERDRGRRFLVVEHFDVGQAGRVLNRDVNELLAPWSSCGG